MKATSLAIPDVILLEPTVYGDNRGYFFESYSQKQFEEATGLSPNFVQDNHSKSTKGVLRGLHYQLPPAAQSKLVRVVEGKVFDVVVDIRKGSPTLGQWTGEVLTSENKKQIWIPVGFAHGFITLSEESELLYKTTDYYAPQFEFCLRWDDPSLNINWQLNGIIPRLSEKDKHGEQFRNIEYFSD
jgi:dTDP-4-dehydrorhamnose 3,5-epimerase